MPLTLTPEIGRRRFIAGGITATLAGASGLILPSLGRAEQRVLTPAQTEGPFYPTQFPTDTDNDLVVVRGSAARAQGVVTHIKGRVLTAHGRPIAGAQVEIWQCDAHGRYLHPGSDGRQPRDTGFQGFGRAVTGPDGAYTFRTIRPVAYAGRTPHIHFAVASAASRLVTQMYVAGEPLNARDGVYAAIRDRRQRDAVTVRLDAAGGIEAGALAGQFDIVLRA